MMVNGACHVRCIDLLPNIVINFEGVNIGDQVEELYIGMVARWFLFSTFAFVLVVIFHCLVAVFMPS